MSNRKLIIPRIGIIVPLTDGNGNLPAEGKVLLLTSYWYQRQVDGDVTFEDVADEAAEQQEAPATPDKEVKTKAKA
jgi:hypothetical protein